MAALTEKVPEHAAAFAQFGPGLFAALFPRELRLSRGHVF